VIFDIPLTATFLSDENNTLVFVGHDEVIQRLAVRNLNYRGLKKLLEGMKHSSNIVVGFNTKVNPGYSKANIFR